MYKIGLIQPKSPETFWNLSRALAFTHKKAHIPPLSLATVAAFTPPEFEVEIIDEAVEAIPFDRPYDIVGITGYYFHARRMFEISGEFRKRGVLTVGGGPFCSGNPGEVDPFFDVLVCGEAENIWPEFLSDWKAGRHQRRYVENQRLDLSVSPQPRWDGVKLEHYTIGIVQTSRGCP
nr:B12-binding domain-containing radical SAM protein [Nitrospinaceae bacterium]